MTGVDFTQGNPILTLTDAAAQRARSLMGNALKAMFWGCVLVLKQQDVLVCSIMLNLQRNKRLLKIKSNLMG